MNTIWLKIAGIAVVAVIVIVVVGQLTGGDSSPAPAPSDAPGTQDKPKTVYDAFERDDKEFRVEPQADEPTATAPTPAPTETPQPPAAPKQPTFEKLSIEDEVQAQRLHETALAERKRSRLPMMTPKLMVDYCREIIRRWPKSQYAFQAKRMLADIPERYKKMYNVTEQEMDLSSFYQ
jgi:hypothetical protein